LHAIHAAHAWGLLGISQSGKDLLYPGAQELIIGAIAFFALFAFMAKWVLPKANSVLTERQAKIQGELEKAEEAKKSADALLAQYRESLTGAKEESNRIITTALAPMARAFSTMRSIAWRRVSSTRRVYSTISPPPSERRPAMMLPPRPRLRTTTPNTWPRVCLTS